MFVAHFNGIHVTRNQKPKGWRYTYHFPNGVVFHTNRSRKTTQELKAIQNGTYVLNQQDKDSYSVPPPKKANKGK